MLRAHRVLVICLAAACGARAVVRSGGQPPVPAPSVSVDSLLSSLSLREKIGQLVVPWLVGSYTAFDDSAYLVAARWVDTLAVGGIIISTGSPYDIAANLTALQPPSPLPPLISAHL